MMRLQRRRGLTRVAVLVIIVVILTALAALVVWFGQIREAARQADCENKLRQLTLACHNYHDSQGGFPMAASPSKANTVNTMGYSFLFEIMPGLEATPLYDQIKQLEPGTTHDPNANRAALPARRGWWVCPSYAGPVFMDETNKQRAITNYKAMSATHYESTLYATGATKGAKYDAANRSRHPDGGMIPLRKLKLREYIDGTANTMFLTETIDQTASYWALGDTAYLWALPSSVEYVKIEGEKPFWAPAGFVRGHYDDAADYATPGTYFNWDYTGTGPNAGSYKYKQMTHGPSSGHPRVINCGFGDGKVRPVAKDIDQALLMFLVTRAGDDPAEPLP